MKLQFVWQSPVQLTNNKIIIVNKNDLDEIDDVAGVYFFARRHGDNSEPFYVGETLQLRARLKNHLESAKIADVLRGMKVDDAPAISNGSRWFHYAYFKAKKGQNKKKCLQIAQKFLIQSAVANNIPLLNSNLTIMKTHDLTFDDLDRTCHVFKRDNLVVI
jgi:hypothetical protein